ncbi:pectate lyase [Streptomyces sp. NBC_01537]|uniref:pectate lyase family protein n=1 Tax=Streptomyces sp. NBC_01537 TaxID=2903896 RepID=UPI00386F5385
MRSSFCHALIAASLATCASLALAAPAQAASPGRAVLPANDGWASSGTGTTGGAAADAAHVFTVRNRAQLVAALNGGDATPKIIQVKGTIDFNTAADGTALTCDDYATDGYSLDAYLTAYDPATWGRTAEPSGPQEDARAASQKVQAERLQVLVGSNTTIVGLGKGATILGGNLMVKGADNVIIRNLNFDNASDCFPAWDPTDGATGNWNSEYDNLTLVTSTHVWVDHNTFSDGDEPDSTLPSYYGRIYQKHDGLFDIIKGSDLVTGSWNVFKEHDKTSLIGNSDSASATDAGKLRVTLHHNLYRNVTERGPRVRFGQVDVYNNSYVTTEDSDYEFGYSLGVGNLSQLVAEANAFSLPGSVDVGTVIKKWKGGTALTADGNYVNGVETDLLAVHNANVPSELLGADAGWTPTLRTAVDAPADVPGIVACHAGAGRL